MQQPTAPGGRTLADNQSGQISIFYILKPDLSPMCVSAIAITASFSLSNVDHALFAENVISFAVGLVLDARACLNVTLREGKVLLHIRDTPNFFGTGETPFENH